MTEGQKCLLSSVIIRHGIHTLNNYNVPHKDSQFKKKTTNWADLHIVTTERKTHHLVCHALLNATLSLQPSNAVIDH